MPTFLEGRHDKHLADAMPLFHWGELEYILGQGSHKNAPFLLLLIDDIVLPLIGLLFHEGHAINVEQKKYLKSLLVADKLLITANVPMQSKFVSATVVGVNKLPLRGTELGLLWLLFVELLPLHELFAPPVVVCKILAVLLLQGSVDKFPVLGRQLAWFYFSLVLEFYPVVEGRTQEMEHELGALGHGVLVNFLRVDLVEEINLKFLKLVILPHNELSVHALGCQLFLLLLGLGLGLAWCFFALKNVHIYNSTQLGTIKFMPSYSISQWACWNIHLFNLI